MATLVSRSSIIASSPPVFRGADHRHFAIASVASIASALREPQYAIFLYDRKVLFFEYVALNALHRIGEQSADAWRPHVAARAFSILVGARSVMTQKGHPAWPDAPDGRNRLALVAACIRRPRRPHRRYFWYPAFCVRPGCSVRRRSVRSAGGHQ